MNNTLHCFNIILKLVSYLDAFSNYLNYAQLPNVFLHPIKRIGTPRHILSSPLVQGKNFFNIKSQYFHWIWTELSHDVLNPAHVPL